jgi:CheY-like chemotaxis protein
MGTNPVMILCVDDDARTWAAMQRLLESASYLTLSASSCAGAIAAAHGAEFDILLTDVGLPDGDGFELLRQIRVRYPIAGIALTGYCELEDRAHAAGLAACLTKPIDFNALLTEIRRAMTTPPTASSVALVAATS